MSKVIQVRNVPDEVHTALRKQAAEAGVSLSDYVLDELKRVSTRSRNAEILIRAAMRPGGATHDQIIEVIHEGRDDRFSDW